MEEVRTAILLDPSWSITQEEEIKAILSDLRRTLGRGRIKLVAVANGFHVLENKAFDLLVIDYGGVAAHGSWGVAEWQLRRVLEWAREHPGGLAVLFTAYTRKVYEGELEREFGHQDNILFHYLSSFSEDEEYGPKLRAWFGGEA